MVHNLQFWCNGVQRELSTTSQPVRTSEALPDPQAPVLPQLDNFSPTQVQRILEAVLQHYRVADATPALSGGITATTVPLLNGRLIMSMASSGKRPETVPTAPIRLLAGPGESAHA